MSRQILAYFISGEFIVRSDGKWTNKPSEYFSLLVDDIPNTIKVFTHLNYCVAALLRALHITEEQGKELLEYKRILVPPYVLEYAPNRYFSLKNDRHFAFFSNIDQYKKIEYETAFKLEDCFEVVKQTKKVGDEVNDALGVIGLHPKSLSSPIGVYEKETRFFEDLPNVNDIPTEAAQMAFDSVDGSWIEAFKIGHFTGYDYDITSAYSYQLSRLKDLREGRWIRTNTKIPEVEYGFYKVKVKINSHFSPVFYRIIKNAEQESYTPVGEFPESKILTLNKMKFIDWSKIGEYKIDFGWCWIPNKDKIEIKYPFNKEVNRLDDLKEHAIGTERKVIKRIMNGMWGKLLQVKDKTYVNSGNETFNPVYGSIVEDNVKLQVASYAIANNSIPLHIAVDGAIFNHQMPTGTPLMGKWRQEKVGKVFILGTAQVAMQGKENDEENTDFSLRYDWLENEIKKNPYAKSYTMKKLSPNTLANAINSNTFKDLGLIRSVNKTVEIGGDSKRMYRNRPIKGGDLFGTYDSIPLEVGMIR